MAGAVTDEAAKTEGGAAGESVVTIRVWASARLRTLITRFFGGDADQAIARAVQSGLIRARCERCEGRSGHWDSRWDR